MRAGKLRRRLNIQQRAPGLDEHGEPVNQWTTVATVWGDVTDTAGSESVRDAATVADVTVAVTLRHRPGINTGMRIKDRNRILEIVAPPIDPQGLGRELSVQCREITVPTE